MSAITVSVGDGRRKRSNSNGRRSKKNGSAGNRASLGPIGKMLAAESKAVSQKSSVKKKKNPQEKPKKNPVAALPPLKVEVIEKKLTSSQRKLLREQEGHFGPVPMREHEFLASDRAVQVQPKLDIGVLSNICAAFCSYAASQDGASGLDLRNAYLYLAKYIQNCAYGFVQAYEFKAAPAVLWDILDSITPRTNGDFTFAFVSTTLVVPANATTNVVGTVFGQVSGSATNGYYTVDPALPAATDLVGYQNCVKMFEDYAEVFDTISRADYPPHIRPDDQSSFAYPEYSSVNDTISSDNIYLGNGTPYSVSRRVSNVPIECEWLARISMVDNSVSPRLLSYGRHSVSMFSSPAAIIVDRMRNKRRNYRAHRHAVALKFVSLFDIMLVADALVDRIRVKGGVTPFLTNNVSFNDFKILITAIAARWCTSWSAVAVGSATGVANSHAYAPGTANVPTAPIFSMKCFRRLEENLAMIKPYMIGDLSVYPILMADIDFDSGNALNAAGDYALNANGVLQTAYEWLTNQILGTTETATYYSTSWRTLTKNWDLAIFDCQQFTAICGPIKSHKVNLASMTNILLDSTNRYSAGFFSLDKIPDEKAVVVQSNLIPNLYGKTANSSYYEASIMTKETRFEPMQPNLSWGNMVANAYISSVHVLTGNGDSTNFEEGDFPDLDGDGLGDIPGVKSLKDMNNKIQTAIQFARLAGLI